MRGELARTIDVIRYALVPIWDDAHGERLIASIARMQKRRHVTRVVASRALGVTLAAAVAAGGEAAGSPLAAAQDASAESAPVAAVPGDAPQRIKLADGSAAVMGSAAAKLEVLRNEPAHVELVLREGSAHFEVAPNEARSFVVAAGPVHVVVVGAVCDVERDDAHVRVMVREGSVRIETPSETRHVGAGGSFWFDLGHAAKDAQSSRPEVELDPAALLEAADAARVSGEPKAAVVYLRRLLREHATSSVAPLAAFTLGRVLLESLGQPAEAAATFALAHRKAPRGSLAQDALAREVEALSKAGRSREAYVRALSYVQQYPTGRRLRAVRLYGGLEQLVDLPAAPEQPPHRSSIHLE